MANQRLEIARLYHRLGFGPKPGEYAQALENGIIQTRKALLAPPQIDYGLSLISEPTITDLGKRPEPNDIQRGGFAIEMRKQEDDLQIWWLDRMAMADHSLTERMVWFWHGHWATAIGKINYAMPMYKQNQRLRKYALGNFSEMSRAMINDGALQFWLDGNESTFKSPNENLARELMELFLLGVNRYSEDDVKNLAKALTGYQVVRSTGVLTFNPKRHDNSPVTILGTTSSFTGESVSDFLVAREDCATFIAERLWYRFISSTAPLPVNHGAKRAFAQREIGAGISALAESGDFANPEFSIVKAPVEWFISVCRALAITPSALKPQKQLLTYLDRLAQVPFAPPNVGGWPADEAWLNSASAQFRIAFATWLVKQGDTSPIAAEKASLRPEKSADWLGVSTWSARTLNALKSARDDPARLTILAICSPEYVVSA